MTGRTQPLWLAAHEAAMDDLPRALAAMGFDRVTAPMPRLGVPVLRCEFQRFRRLQRHPDDATALAWDAAYRERLAEMNRAQAFSPVRLAMQPARAVYVDTIRGDWADTTGGARGTDLITLAALCWGQTYGRAAFRLARTCGLEAIPDAA